jgi:hypothetical protein
MLRCSAQKAKALGCFFQHRGTNQGSRLKVIPVTATRPAQSHTRKCLQHCNLNCSDAVFNGIDRAVCKAVPTFAAAVPFQGNFYQEARCGILILIVLIILLLASPASFSPGAHRRTFNVRHGQHEAVIVNAEELVRKR